MPAIDGTSGLNVTYNYENTYIAVMEFGDSLKGSMDCQYGRDRRLAA